jgi:hypothetical protein
VEFEKAFALEDDSEEPSGTSTPSISVEKPAAAEGGTPTTVGPADDNEKGEEKQVNNVARQSNELPPEVRSKLRKLETLESKYKGV